MSRRVRGRRRGGSGKLILWLLLLLLIAGGVFFAYKSPIFEREKPQILTTNTISANTKTPIKFTIKDNSGLKSCKVVLSSDETKIPIYNQKFLIKSKDKTVEVKLPKEVTNSKKDNWNIIITATDSSLWGFFMGNKSQKIAKLIIDNTPPQISTIASSQNITKGGSAIVIYKIDDKNLKDTYIEISKNIKFKPIKYRKNGVYASLIVWPFNQDSFNPKIVAIDKANNKSEHSIQISKIDREYKVSKIKASDRFINGKISQLAQQDPDYSNISGKLDKFRAVNEKMREKNENLIHKYTKSVTPFNKKWDIKPFKPLKGYKRVSDFGVKRYYYYKTPDNIISTSYHVGYDLASVKHDNLYANSGKVVFAGYNGIYGNMPIIDHKFGLYTLYGHCSSILVEKNQKIQHMQTIAKTGATGLALGDHVHFGVLIQGVEVLPLEWMKSKWIDTHINAIFKKADSILGYN